MPLDGQLRILPRHPFAVVFNRNELLAAELDGNRQPPRTRVDGVLHELFDDRCRTLDDFTSRNLIGQLGGQPVDAAHSQRIRRNSQIMPPETPKMHPTIHQNCEVSPPGKCGSGTFMP